MDHGISKHNNYFIFRVTNGAHLNAQKKVLYYFGSPSLKMKTIWDKKIPS